MLAHRLRSTASSLAEQTLPTGTSAVLINLSTGAGCQDLAATRQQSNGAASTSRKHANPHNVLPEAAGRGYGFRTRFKDMSDKELELLLQQTKGAGGATKLTQGPQKVAPLPPEYKAGAFAAQWSLQTERVQQPYKPQDINRTDMFAVIEAGHTQYKVTPDDKLFLHRLNGVDVNDIVRFHRVLLCGTPQDTLVGRPFLPGVAVTAAVEEQIRDSTVYIYKRRRAKGYRRFRGFRADLTGVRVLAIHGTDALGVPVPEWREGASTPLRATPTLGQRVRAWRGEQRRRERAAEHAEQDRFLQDRRAALEEVSPVSSSPYIPDELPEGPDEYAEEAEAEDAQATDTARDAQYAESDDAQDETSPAPGDAQGDSTGLRNL